MKIKIRRVLLCLAIIVSIVVFARDNSSGINTNDEEAAARINIWLEHLQSESQNIERISEMENREIHFGDVSMRFTYFVRGTAPDDGFPLFIALHGGGATPVNESQYRMMMIYYQRSVQNGIYVAVRAVRDTWDCHFNPESYPIYDRLIENMIIFRNVDPNRVYLMGFSAGGDGIYGITPRMADRFAAVCMSAGHHNNVNPINLKNTPILLQCGDGDRAYNRNVETVQFGVKLADLQQHWTGYEHQVNIHVNKGHNFADNDSARRKQQVWSNPVQWMLSQNSDISEINTNAVDFLQQYTRNPLPQSIMWDLSTRAPLRDVESFYWLRAPKNMTEGRIFASLHKPGNSITINTKNIVDSFDVLLNRTMLNFDEPITVTVNDSTTIHRITSSKDFISETTKERGDFNFQFSAKIRIEPCSQILIPKPNQYR